MTPASTPPRTAFQTLTFLAKYLWPKNRSDLRFRVCLALAFLFVGKVINVWMPFFFKDAVDSLSRENAFRVLPLIAIVAYAVGRVLAQVFNDLRDYVFVRVSAHAQRSIALETFDHLHQLSLQFHLDRQTGGLSRMIDRGTHGIQSVLSFMLFNIVPTLFEISFVAIVLAKKFSALFSAVIVVTITAYIVFTLTISEWRIKFRKALNESDMEANTKAIDSLINFETVKYFGNEKLERARYDEALHKYESANIRAQSSLGFLNTGQSMIIAGGLMILLFFSGKKVVAGQATVGDFVLLNTLLLQLYFPLNFLGFAYREIKQGLIDMEKMFSLLDYSSDVKDSNLALPYQFQGGSIDFHCVDFSYDKRKPLLQNLSFHVDKGQTVALVGPSGCGKSTISKLIFRFYDVQSGSILIDGKDIRDYRQDSLRKVIGIVPQDTVMFNETLDYNLRYGNANANDQQLQHAIELAELDLFVAKLPEGLQTRVGERGLKLSGGEKQRVAIARMILKNPYIMIFDEATSALDSATEKEIQKSIFKVSQERTTLIIAHRLSTIVHADLILVLDQGHIIEQGTHPTLLGQNGTYAQMWLKQLEGHAREAADTHT